MKKQIQQRLSFFLLIVILASQVGLHLLHHHTISEHKSPEELSFHAEDHQHCLLCDLDVFIPQELPVEFNFAHHLSYEGTLKVSVFATVSFSVIFHQGRAPPAC